MALLTIKIRERMVSLRAASHGGIAERIGQFIRSSVNAIEPMVESEHFTTRAEINNHLDVLEELVSTWVHAPQYARATPASKK